MFQRPELLVPLIVFCIVTLFTPGPNNLMLMTSGLNHGLKRTIPHMLGVALGFPFLVLCVGLGLGVIFTTYPIVYTVIKYAGAAYMLYLAWVIARSAPPNVDSQAKTSKKPITFFQAAAFQWVNPKGWAMAVSSVATYTAIADYPLNMIVIGILFTVFGLASSVSWAGLGVILQKFLHRPKLVRGFNILMAILLVASLYPVIADAAH
jgi:threonine/homoserine/homoserine lactone efflux protein